MFELIILPTAQEAQIFKYVLPELSYSYSSLEPYIDEETMKIHHNKHHQAYIDNLNAALKDYPEIAKKKLYNIIEDLDSVPEAIRTTVRNNGGGHLNHSMFWQLMVPKASKLPTDKIKKEIEKYFVSFDNFKKLFSDEAKKRFGSGWAWLCLDKHNKLIITSTANQDNPISVGLMPILGLDVWEHAYYLKYRNKRVDYIDSWWNIINWKFVEKLYDAAVR